VRSLAALAVDCQAGTESIHLRLSDGTSRHGQPSHDSRGSRVADILIVSVHPVVVFRTDTDSKNW